MLKILDCANAPYYLYKHIIKWATEAEDSKITFSHMMKTRKGIIKHTKRLMPWLQATRPKEVEILLETPNEPQPTNVILFDFKKQLLSLLNDKSLFGDIKTWTLMLMIHLDATRLQAMFCQLSILGCAISKHIKP